MSNVYVLVADGSRGKVYQSRVPLRAAHVLDLVYDQVHFQSRRKAADLVSDRAGVQRSGTGGFHSFAGHEDSQEREQEEFARDLCRHLESERRAGRFDELVIAAPPHFLGLLRRHLSDGCREVLSESVDHNLLQLSDKELIERLA